MKSADQTQIELIDANPEPRNSIAFMLRCAGFVVRTHESARKFVDQSEVDLGSIVLMDVPGLEFGNSCHDVCTLKTVGLRPTIFMSALPEPELVSDAFEIGIVEFLSKPFYKSDLIEAIEAIISSPSGDLCKFPTHRANKASLSRLVA